MGKESIYSPFNLKIAKMKKIMLINIEKDLDEIYSGFEPQCINFLEDDEAIRILAYRNDGYVDIYQEKELPKDENENLEVTGKGLGDFISLDMENSKFKLSELGADIHFKFKDKLGRDIELKVKENLNKRTKPFSLLAPVGSSSVNPVLLPVFFLYDFCFVRKNKTEVIIKIGEKIHKADGFFPMDGHGSYFMRYARKSVIGEWNRSINGVLTPLKVMDNIAIDSDGATYELEKENEGYSIRCMKAIEGQNAITVKFNPPFKDINFMKDKEELKGDFIIRGEEQVGSIQGTYKVNRSRQDIKVIAIPDKGWMPNEKRLSIKFIFFAGKIFKTWTKTYKWTANIKLNGEENPKIESKWERI